MVRLATSGGSKSVRHDPAECGQAAFDSVVQLSITPTPDNFAIWYEYHSGLNPELTHLIDLLLSKPGRCDDQTMAAVHRKFFSHVRERDALRAASERMQALLQEVGVAVGEAGDDARQFGAAVRDTSSAFANGTTTLPELIQRLREEARAMADRSEAIGQHLAGAAERIAVLERSLDDLRQDAATDSLTRLNNRRSFDARLRDAAGQAMNSGAPLALVLVDIDHFKRVNDEWGHQTGDQVLRLVAGMLTAHTRPEDFAARYGGEEFALILDGTCGEAAVAVAERVRRGFEGREIVARTSGRSIGIISVSAGVALYEPGERLTAWIERADQAMYAAKRAGRNRVLLAPAEPAPCAAGPPVAATA
jgi:diguanylate cyclase